MAPPPEYAMEPKAPDKSVTNLASEETKSLLNQANEHQTTSDNKPTNATANSEVENNKHVEQLDDGQLKALLDEAITYKCPKDREGKSSLFNELLEEVEQDEEQALEAAARELSGSRATRRGQRPRRHLAHSNSLQNLEQEALAAESALRRVRHAQPHSTVSARAIHGGSLPSDVDKSFLLGEEGGRAGYLATVQCYNPPPLNERRVSASDANSPNELDVINKRSKPPFPMMYTARATLEIGSGAVGSARATTTTTNSNQVDSTIPFNCITSSEVVDSCTTTSTTQAAVSEDPKPLQLGSSYRAVASLTGAPPHHASHPPRNLVATTFNSMALARGNYGATNNTPNDEYKKSLDENGNAVQGFSSPLSGSSQHKKPRRKKSSKNETVITSHQIDGYQGNKDLNEVLRFIESNADTGRGGKLRAKHKDDSDDKGGKKRSTDRRKDKEKMKRATSMEELSRTKLEDLTDKPAKKERWTEGAGKAERRSWGDESREGVFYREEVSDADFQTVTKKRKPRRRPDDPARSARAPSPRAHTDSDSEERPDDRSDDRHDDRSDDRPEDRPDAPLTAPPLVSYADIARTRHNIPDLIESCNYYSEDAPDPPPPTKEPYPALGTPTPRHHNNKERVTTLTASCGADADADGDAGAGGPAPDVVADRRPPVVLLDCGAAPDMDGVTFGFDINEQLLGGVTGRPRCDLVLDAVSGSVSSVTSGTAASEASAAAGERRPLRYVPPITVPLNTQMLQIIDYVSTAWEDVVRCGSGKVRYFNE